MFRALKVRVTPAGVDNKAVWFIGAAILTGCTALTLAAVPTLPAATVALVGGAVSVTWAVLGWFARDVFLPSSGGGEPGRGR